MNSDILELPIIIKTGPFEKNDIPIVVDETGKLIPEIIATKRFGITDLWNIRKKGRYFSIYGEYM